MALGLARPSDTRGSARTFKLKKSRKAMEWKSRIHLPSLPERCSIYAPGRYPLMKALVTPEQWVKIHHRVKQSEHIS